ncbi:MAG TPA: oligoendopeptidase F [Ignavibacteriaceae bacterium]|nr:oligoendopeptidase F [Ignavibacteriaceae bacterium]
MIESGFEGKKLHAHQAGGSVPTREQIELKYKWDLTHIYPTEDLWEEDFKLIENHIDEYKKFEGTISGNPEALLKCLKFDDDTGIKLDKLRLYTMLAKDSDMKDTKYQAMEGRINSLYIRVTAASSFIRPELLQVDDQKLLGMIDSLKELKVYKHLAEDLLRIKSHTLNKEQEELLAMANEIAHVPYNTFSMFTNADLKFPYIKDERGNEIEITHARYYAAIYSQDGSYRKRAFENYLKPFKENANTLSVLFNGGLKSNIFQARARKYKSAREAALDRNCVNLSIYDNLVEATNRNLNQLHRWAYLKKKVLNLNELHPYDVYVSLFSLKGEKKYGYEEGKKIVIESLKPLGEEYLKYIQTAFDNRWIDVYETQAKRSGAYSSGSTFGVHPYVLLNWTDLLNDVFTLTHEMGHNMHSYFTGTTQPYPYANYSIFLAEVTSTFNESLLLDYLIEHSETELEKLFFLEKYLNNISSTFYRQTMFAEFEKIVYEKAENGETLTPDVLCGIYKEVFQKYWGPEMVVDKLEEYSWARIPHFYYNFYVYQYATGFAASEILARKVKTQGKPAVEKYLDFLKAGSSDYPLNILNNAGVDMSSVEPVEAVTEKMEFLLDEVEGLLSH